MLHTRIHVQNQNVALLLLKPYNFYWMIGFLKLSEIFSYSSSDTEVGDIHWFCMIFYKLILGNKGKKIGTSQSHFQD